MGCKCAMQVRNASVQRKYAIQVCTASMQVGSDVTQIYNQCKYVRQARNLSKEACHVYVTYVCIKTVPREANWMAEMMLAMLAATPSDS